MRHPVVFGKTLQETIDHALDLLHLCCPRGPSNAFADEELAVEHVAERFCSGQ